MCIRDRLVSSKLKLLSDGRRTMEDFDMRILTSGVYIHGLEAWGAAWPAEQLLVMRSEDLFASTGEAMQHIHVFLGLAPQPARTWAALNRNSMRSKSRPSRWLNETLDAFFAPFNERLYRWASARNIDFGRWDNATSSRSRLDVS